MMSKIIYTCVTDSIDKVYEPRIVMPNCEYLCFTDQPFESKVWSMRPLLKELETPRKTARYHKTIGCNALNASMILWQDAKIEFTSSAQPIFDALGNNTISLFRHPARICIYEEAIKVIHLKKAPHATAKQQVKAYREQQHPENWGLFETAVIIRNGPKSQLLNTLWWEQIEQFTERDQISLPFILRKHGIDFNPLETSYRKNGIFKCREHETCNYFLRLKHL